MYVCMCVGADLHGKKMVQLNPLEKNPSKLGTF